MKNFENINRKASHDYTFVETYVAGIVLNGNEIVAIREGHIDISEAFCYFIGNELFLKNSVINGGDNNTSRIFSIRDRKLLLNKDELKKIREQVKIKGLTVIPYKVIINEKNLCKVVIAVAKGKKTYDKRQAIKERDLDRQARREI